MASRKTRRKTSKKRSRMNPRKIHLMIKVNLRIFHLCLNLKLRPMKSLLMKIKRRRKVMF